MKLQSTTVEIILYYLTLPESREYHGSTTVEIILYYLTAFAKKHADVIYNSRNYSILLNHRDNIRKEHIYNSRNYSILLNDIGNQPA